MRGFQHAFPVERLSPHWQAWLADQSLSPAGDHEADWIVGIWRAPESLEPPSRPTLLEQMVWTLECHPAAAWVVQPLRIDLDRDSPCETRTCPVKIVRQILDDGCILLGRRRGDTHRGDGTLADWVVADARRKRVLLITRALSPIVSVSPKGLRVRRGWLPLLRWIRGLGRTTPSFRLRQVLEGAVAGVLKAGQEMAQRLSLDPWLARQTLWRPRMARAEIAVAPRIPDDRIRILMAMHWLELGGAERGALDLIQRLPASRFAVYVSTDVPSRHSWEPRIASRVEEIWHLPSFLPRRRAPEFFDHLIRSRKIHVLHIHHSAWAYESLPFLRRFHQDLAAVDTLHILELPPSPGGYPEWSAAAFEPFLDAHHVTSDFLARFLRERWGVPEAKIRRIYTNVDTSLMNPESVPRGMFRTAWNVSPEALVVVFAGRFVRQKRPFLFLRMARLLARRWEGEGRRTELRFVMAGSGPLLRRARRLAQRLRLSDRVIFPGELEDMRTLYRDADLLVLSSENEGLAFVAFEALAMGLPLISTDVGAQKELLSPDQLVPFDAHVEKRLADAAWRVLRDDEIRKRLSEEGIRRVKERHRIEDTVTAMEALYAELLNRRRPLFSAGRPVS